MKVSELMSWFDESDYDYEVTVLMSDGKEEIPMFFACPDKKRIVILTSDKDVAEVLEKGV